MKFRNVTYKEFAKLVGIMFFVVFIVSNMFLNYLIDRNILMYGFVIQDSLSIFGFQIPQRFWVVIVSFIITIVCTIGGLLIGFILETFFKITFKLGSKVYNLMK